MTMYILQSSLLSLQLGSSPLGLSDLHLVDQLCVFMNGGPKSEVSLPRTAGEGHLVLVCGYWCAVIVCDIIVELNPSFPDSHGT